MLCIIIFDVLIKSGRWFTSLKHLVLIGFYLLSAIIKIYLRPFFCNLCVNSESLVFRDEHCLLQGVLSRSSWDAYQQFYWVKTEHQTKCSCWSAVTASDAKWIHKGTDGPPFKLMFWICKQNTISFKEKYTIIYKLASFSCRPWKSDAPFTSKTS